MRSGVSSFIVAATEFQRIFVFIKETVVFAIATIITFYDVICRDQLCRESHGGSRVCETAAPLYCVSHVCTEV
ncbi:unnamed protein product [Thelazia callipaeda]|uniref:Secreted protein n=1 Tax=Thelazia callipaeda TaxID=103827 RepID=A0A0N5CMP4_THECL|nr:unnamed protein product [Thelazia callipaeda]